MLNIKLICVGSLKEPYLRDAAKEYEKRLFSYCRLGVIEIKEEKDSANEIMPYLSAKSYKIALCIEGEQKSSEEFSVAIHNAALRGASEIIFVIGGSNGLSETVKSVCNLRLSFSKMTFPHQLMRVIVLEQIYRAFTIQNNGKYHK